MKNYVIHDDTGRILQTGQCPDDMVELQGGDGRQVIEGEADDAIHYVRDGEVAERPPMAIGLSKASALADGADEVLLSGVPAGAALTISGPVSSEAIADGDEIALVFLFAGAYRVRFVHFPYLDQEFIIHAA